MDLIKASRGLAPDRRAPYSPPPWESVRELSSVSLGQQWGDTIIIPTPSQLCPGSLASRDLKEQGVKASVKILSQRAAHGSNVLLGSLSTQSRRIHPWWAQ